MRVGLRQLESLHVYAYGECVPYSKDKCRLFEESQSTYCDSEYPISIEVSL